MKYRYCDMHCDTLTAEGNLQATFERHRAGGCYLQCFAAFLFQPDGSLYRRALSAFDKFDGWCKEYGLNRVGRFSDLKENAVNAVLTVEEGAAIEGDLKKLDEFYARGVRMMTLTWNFANRLGYPNLSDYTGADALPNAREGARGLTEFGVSVVEHMKELHMIVDVSHGSDALVRDVKQVLQDTPFVASHSDAASVFDCPRNLRDEEIRTIAESGGVIGLNFCADFLSEDKSKEGQRAARTCWRSGAILPAFPRTPFCALPPMCRSCLQTLKKRSERASPRRSQRTTFCGCSARCAGNIG